MINILEKLGNIISNVIYLHRHNHYIVSNIYKSSDIIPAVNSVSEGYKFLKCIKTDDKLTYWYYIKYKNEYHKYKLSEGDVVSILGQGINSVKAEVHLTEEQEKKYYNNRRYFNYLDIESSDIKKPLLIDNIHEGTIDPVILIDQYIVLTIQGSQYLALLGSDKVSRLTNEDIKEGDNKYKEKVLSDYNFSGYYIQLINSLKDYIDTPRTIYTRDIEYAPGETEKLFISLDKLNKIDTIPTLDQIKDIVYSVIPQNLIDKLSNLTPRNDLDNIDISTEALNEYLTAQQGAVLRDRIKSLATEIPKFEVTTYEGVVYYTLEGDTITIVGVPKSGVKLDLSNKVEYLNPDYDPSDSDSKQYLIGESTQENLTCNLNSTFKLSDKVIITDNDGNDITITGNIVEGSEDLYCYYKEGDDLYEYIAIKLNKDQGQFEVEIATISDNEILTPSSGLSIVRVENYEEAKKAIGRENLDVYSRKEVNDLVGSGEISILRLVPLDDTESTSEQLISNKNKNDILISVMLILNPMNHLELSKVVLFNINNESKGEVNIGQVFTAKYSDYLKIEYKTGSNEIVPIKNHYNIDSFSNYCVIHI
jgi:hypothetical protein